MDKYFKQISGIFEVNNYDYLDNASYEEKMLCLYGYYNFYHADNSSIQDLIGNISYEADSPDNIDGVFLDSESDEDTVEIVSSYYVLDGSQFISIDVISDYYKNMYNHIIEAVNKGTSERRKLIGVLSSDEEFNFFVNKKRLRITIITNYQPKMPEKKKYISFVDTIKIKDNVECKIVFGQDLEQMVMEIESPKEYVDKGIIRIDRSNNYLKFGNENSIIVNVSAKSIKDLYEKYSTQGLFSQNLRYYVKSAKTDSKIIDSIQNNGDLFWYLNNGIIIICDNYDVSSDVISLYEFSIINGGQTTKLIGDTDFDNDFYIQCKIVRNKYSNVKQKSDFISQVAEASNTQKPIKDKDLVANRVEQRELNRMMKDIGVFVQIKRGAPINKKVYSQPWQNTTNEELGQLLYSFMYQNPGSARNNKNAITGNKDKYDLIFKKDYNPYLLKDLIYIKSFYKIWVKHCSDQGYYDDQYMQGILKNGMFFFVGVIGIICKLYFHREYLSQIAKCEELSKKNSIISQYDISHRLFCQDENILKESLYSLFDRIYKGYIRDAYIDAKDDNNSLAYSNFTKIDKNYVRYVMKSILKYTNEQDLEALSSIMYKASESEKQMDLSLLENYCNVSNNNSITKEDLDKDELELFDKFKKYRSSKYRNTKGLKAYNIYLDKDILRFIKEKPQNINDLIDMGILDTIQINAYGNDIIDILNKN